MGSIPTFAMLGDLEGALAQAVNGPVRLTGFTSSAFAAADGALVDGATGAADIAALDEILRSGKVVAIADPTDEQRRDLLALTGQTPASNVPLVVYWPARTRTGSSCRVVPAPGPITSTVVGGPSTTPVGTMSAPAERLGHELARAVTSAPATDPATYLVPGFVPTIESSAGYSSFTTPINWSIPFPQNAGSPDDNIVQRNNQSTSCDLLTELYVYWVNGTRSTDGYFVVIVRQVGPLALGTVGASCPESRGYFQLSFEVGVSCIGLADPTLLTYSPTTESDDSLQVTVAMSLPLWAGTNSGVGYANVPVSTDSTTAFSGWGVLDQTAADGPSWLFHQREAWDPTQTPPAHPSLLQQLYDATGAVVQVPALSLGPLAFQALSVWQLPAGDVAGDHPAPPTTFPVTFSVTWSQTVGFAHNPAGCAGAFGTTARHVFTQNQQGTVQNTVDLSAAANSKNYPGGDEAAHPVMTATDPATRSR